MPSPKNRSAKTKENELESLYLKKISFLEELIRLQNRQMEVLSFGDGENAAKLEHENSRLMESMMSLDRKIERLEESYPQSLEIIRLSDEIFRKLEESRDLNEKVGLKMEEILHEYRKELNLVQAEIQLKRFLTKRKLGWKTGTC
ncbi:hypothetical protein ACE5IS_03320 [Leptospira wolffii]|uniref:Flagellar protein FlgN n=1 Tax=Leptospira wolffii TaxID=409998 RepID=A0A2M9ZDG2_9LEPT|nr:hypothetical protein [Leptospira wolffii]EPG68149.1 hypothetical protein LEP1GSC061_0550 [Leptospira wolffii serovar Khorat str. Khorat-H2]PJZ66465.1 hypothetical protein CH371_09410 [Leptospira wolffii]TGK59967.1 hypothetical protein EHQ32_08625 [Leptospira wolffii]TGK70043.1 hypothetical protein EHQ27_12540 [Leptospira wolffii]TGK75975.1 hypothetical protein EHQ35_01375 [Leptospira wolffii]